MIIKLEDITKKYPFIYEINNDYYIMGLDAFEKCQSDRAINRYKEYKAEINRLGREAIQQQKYDNSDDFSALVFYFRKVMSHANINSSFEECSKNRHNLHDFLCNLKPSEKEILLRQLEDYVAVFGYYNRMFCS